MLRLKCFIWLFISLIQIKDIYSQDKLPNLIIIIPTESLQGSKENFIRILEDKYNYIVSYNAAQFEMSELFLLKKNEYSLQEFVETIFSESDISIYFRAPNKIIIAKKGKSTLSERIIIRGYIYDKTSNDALIGALVTEMHSNTTVSTNENGYYYMIVPKGKLSLDVQYLGYLNQPLQVHTDVSIIQNFSLESNNQLPEIIISDRVRDRINFWNSGEIIDIYKTKEFTSILGERDLINNARILPGVQSGGEGQTGLLVRGGSSDQNLILLEGIPIYESNHVAGISSIFIDESIKEASLIKNGFPARYGGRLSSVLDIHLKDGNPEKHEKSISLGLPGIKLHLNGPLSGKKTTYNFSARASWINQYVNNVLKPFTKFDDIKLNFNDAIIKLSHKFSEGNKLAFTFYNGSDKMELRKNESLDTIGYVFKSFDTNQLQWGNRLANLSWHKSINNKLNININAGTLSYKHRSRSSYVFETILNQETNRDELDVLSYADIMDLITSVHADYHLSEKHTLKGGFQYIGHRFNPVVKQSLIILQGEAANILDNDSTIFANEYSFYIEDNFKVNNVLFLYGGLHLSNFNVGNKTYRSLQPRLNLLWTPGGNQIISFAFSKMTQNIHQLVNSGLGLPSNLWVPSTQNIAPQHASQFSVSYSKKFNQAFYLNVGLYQKKLTNLLEYTTPTDLFYFFINDQNVVPVYNNTRDWERNIFTGTGNSRGAEFMLQRKGHTFSGWTSVTYSKSTRNFKEINQGKTFPYTYDRTWDINAGMSYQFSSAFSGGLNGVYGTGNAFTLATEEFDSFLGIRLLNPDGRNNYRLPSFMQLSLNLHYTIPSPRFTTKIDFNIYNIFNRLNAYYIYVYKNPVTKDSILRKVSILPLTPSINITVVF